MTGLNVNIGAVRLANPLVLAPLAGVTNLPFRLIAKEHGVGLTVTEMVSAVGLTHRGAKTMKLMDTSPMERPLSVQLFGRDPDSMAEGAIIAQEAGADIIDVNMGCPARKVVRHGSGAALLMDFELIAAILKRMRAVVRVPLTVKTRAGWKPGEGEILDLVPILVDCGVDAVTLHPRFGLQRFGGRADWDLISRLVERFPGPVIGNGDIVRPEEAVERLQNSGCTAVMIGRGALGNPWIFSRTLELLKGGTTVEPGFEERLRTGLGHARLLRDYVGPQRATYMLRSILMWYTKGLPDSAAFRRSINQIKDYELLEEMIESYFASLCSADWPEAATA